MFHLWIVDSRVGSWLKFGFGSCPLQASDKKGKYLLVYYFSVSSLRRFDRDVRISSSHVKMKSSNLSVSVSLLFVLDVTHLQKLLHKRDFKTVWCSSSAWTIASSASVRIKLIDIISFYTYSNRCL